MIVTRRKMLQSIPAAASAALLAQYHSLVSSEKKHVKIRDIKVMMLQGPRTYTVVKVETDAGLYGMGEAYGSPGCGSEGTGSRPQSLTAGEGSLEIDAIYTGLYEANPYGRIGSLAHASRQRDRDRPLGSGGKNSRSTSQPRSWEGSFANVSACMITAAPRICSTPLHAASGLSG